MTDAAADLETEIQRLRIRIIALSPQQLDEPGAAEPTPGTGAASLGSSTGRDHTRALSRRETITEALAEFSAIGSGGRPVPPLGDGSLADQVIVLLEHGASSVRFLSEAAAAERLSELLAAAVRLRRNLA